MTKSVSDLQKNKVLFIAYFYPPCSSTEVPGSLRTVKFVRNLNNGQCHILTTRPAVGPDNDALGHIQLPVKAEIIHRVRSWDVFKVMLWLRQSVRKALGKGAKSGASKNDSPTSKKVFEGSASQTESERGKFQHLKDFIYNLCYFPDQAGPWIIPAFIKGFRVVQKNRLNVIFATGSPWSGLIVGYLISKATGKPLIIDFRDPWMNNPFHQSKGQVLDKFSYSLERRVVRHAVAVSLNTEPLMQDFVARYQDIPAEKFFVMPNGFDSADFDKIKAEPRIHDQDTLLLCHAGFLYGVRDPDVLLKAIRLANETLAESGKRVVFRQIGDVQLNYNLEERYADLLESESLILESSRPYQECLSALASADAVVNIQPATQTQVPSKLYDYLGINRPIIHITSKDGALGRLVAEKQIGTVVEFDDDSTLADLLVSLAEDMHSNNFSGYDSRDDFDIQRISAVLAEKCIQHAK
ncbi:glycosyltransferase [Marinobacter sp. PE14]